ncbi:hypothetical protein P3X46_029913 [Hevea brasiliensis]|uniref:Uncharacterized protein n=1 Tax=Hevea brasiliensis TaxID=3981 RepID=A0ABQ9KUW8_HEVBR|nr:pheromone-processing carboxypeptidase KEX1-like [Hevea brasiliensis]KAJ9147792.1 hypothetical protein P3X46_029913 [Hevea brasiliensis]
MELIVSPALVFLILSLAATLVLNFSSSLFLFSMFNTIILAVVFGNCRPSVEEVDGAWYSFQSSYEDGQDSYDNIVKDEDNDSDVDDDDDQRENYFSDGYDEDDDDSGSDGEIGWEDDDEEIDDNLQRRIEDFIAKVNKGWREEWLRENHQNQTSKLG